MLRIMRGFNQILLLSLLSLTAITNASMHPISIYGRYFMDSVTKDPFFIRGVDYQPGGSSGVSVSQDPLSDADACARDIVLFQELGINTIRVYSVNPDLNHDKCMSMLAQAGIYLVLDVNSPLPNENLNRYEPWTSYNEFYLEHIFKVVEQFSYYPNTLAFFAGNEVVNDRRSAKASSIYVKAVIRDLKAYIEAWSPRKIPVGYSAADDLNYRISFAKYLECEEDKASVDFYGVNSYQWCGEQTFQSSGFNRLVDDYHDYTKPIFFSEYGCNEVQPRIFQEVPTLYSKDMTGVFSGGLVYEFSQEANNYGLVEHEPNGNVQILPDFYELKKQYENTPDLTGNQLSSVYKTLRQRQRPAVCHESYENLEISNGLPISLADYFIEKGVSVNRGKLIPLRESDLQTSYQIINADGSNFNRNTVTPKIDIFAKDDNIVTHGIFENGMYIDFINEEDEFDDVDEMSFTEEQEQEQEQQDDDDADDSYDDGVVNHKDEQLI